MPKSPEWYFPLSFPTKMLYASHISRACNMSCHLNLSVRTQDAKKDKRLMKVWTGPD